jgi:hypothetical protein
VENVILPDTLEDIRRRRKGDAERAELPRQLAIDEGRWMTLVQW